MRRKLAAAARARWRSPAPRPRWRRARATPTTRPARPSPIGRTIREMRFTVQQVNGHAGAARGRADRRQSDPAPAGGAPGLSRATKSGCVRPAAMPGSATRPGRLIRHNNMTTRIPAGWACFSACNFLFMGGAVRHVDPGGLFIVHMFTYTATRGDPPAGRARRRTTRSALIARHRAGSALLASEDNDFLIRMGISRTAADRGHVPAERRRRRRRTARRAAA